MDKMNQKVRYILGILSYVKINARSLLPSDLEIISTGILENLVKINENLQCEDDCEICIEDSTICPLYEGRN